MSRRFRSLLAASLLSLAAGCGGRHAPEVPRETVRDLIADLDLAETQREPGVVDLGTAGARPLLRKGWSQDETEGGRTFVWSDGPESELRLFLATPRDVPLILKGSAYAARSAPGQEVTLVLNGETVGKVTLTPGDDEVRAVLPERHLRAGENRLVLRYAWTRSPSEESGRQGDDHRRLAVAWDFLRFETGVDEQGRVRAAGGQLSLPFGWRMDSYLRLPAGAALAMDGLRARGEDGELRVTLQPEGGEEREVARLRPDGRPATVDLGDAGPGLARLSLMAVPDEPGEGDGSGLVLRRPVLAAPRAKTASAVERRTPDSQAGPVLPASLPSPARPAPGPRPLNVLVYLVDTLRADHLGCYGYTRPVSPRVDAFSRQAVRFRHTVAQSSWTRPSTCTILTGLLPRTHGVNGRRDVLSEAAVTLAERLRERGYETAGFITNGNVARGFGLAQGFETYRMLPGKRNSAADVNAAAAEWLATRWTKAAPFFLYLHTAEPHAPYSPPAPFRQRFAPGAQDESLSRLRFVKRLERREIEATQEVRKNLLDLYDAEIAANDDAFGALLDLLVERGLWQDTVVVFLSDHGEEFLDHGGWEHGKTLHNEMLDVPLIVRAPGLETGKVVARQAQHVDVVPTLLDLLSLPLPPGLEGRSLLPWMAGPGVESPDDAETEAFSWLDEGGIRSAAVTTPAWRLIENRLPIPARLLYDRRADPSEHRDLAGQRPVRTGFYGARLRGEERLNKGKLRAGEATVDAELRKQLEALGYLGH